MKEDMANEEKKPMNLSKALDLQIRKFVFKVQTWDSIFRYLTMNIEVFLLQHAGGKKNVSKQHMFHNKAMWSSKEPTSSI